MIESKASELAEVKRKLWKKDSFIDTLNSEQQEALKASFDKLDESDNLCREVVTKN